MRQFKNDVKGVTHEFKALSKRIGQLTSHLTKTAVEGLEQAQAAVKLKSPAQRAAEALKGLTRQMEKLTKAVERFEQEKGKKKQAVKREAKTKSRAKKAALGKAVPKKASPATATDRVIKVIGRSKKGIDVPTLTKKTGYDPKKVRSIVSNACKQGKIKRIARGVYIAP
jgi:exonuclease VII large subunit